jgi:hypothetical protein
MAACKSATPPAEKNLPTAEMAADRSSLTDGL